MSKLIVSLVPKGGEEYKYVIENSEYRGYSTTEALSKYFLESNIDFKILLLRPESINQIEELKIIEKIRSLGILKKNISSQEIPITGSYEGKRYITDPKIISDFIFLSLKDNYSDEIDEIILDVSRGLNFLVLVAVEALRRFIVATKARHILNQEKIPKFFYVYLTPINEKERINEIILEKMDSPFFLDYFKNYDKLPFNFKDINEKEELYSEFNFIKKLLSIVNTCIYSIKRGFILAFLTILPWKDIKLFLEEAEEKLSLNKLKELNIKFSEEKSNIIERKYNLHYPLGNLWIYIFLLFSFYEIYLKYKDKIREEDNLKWVSIETLRKFNEEIINKTFKEPGTEIIVSRELTNFELKFKKGEKLVVEGKPSDIKRNFNAHAGLIVSFLEQNPKNYAIAYNYQSYKNINNLLKEWF
ncbi:MAG: TM1812 family CRISPR-associated protein [Dictyoglomaceae bacterium]